jgi:hypothetical protein
VKASSPDKRKQTKAEVIKKLDKGERLINLAKESAVVGAMI